MGKKCDITNIITAAVTSVMIMLSINVHVRPHYTFFDIEDNSMMIMLAYAGMFFWTLWIRRSDVNEVAKNSFFKVIVILGCFILSIITFAGKSYIMKITFEPQNFFETIPYCIRTIIAIAGGLLLYWNIIMSIMILYDRIYMGGKPDLIHINWIEKIVDGKNSFFKCVLFLSLVWLPQIIVRYPGIMQIDSWGSLHHYWNPEIWTSQHPVVFTLILGRAVDYGLSLGHIEWGVFALVLVQVALTILSMAYTVTVLKHFNISGSLRFAALLFYAFLPLFSAFATTVIIDAPYFPAFLLMITELSIAVFDIDYYISKPYHVILTALSVVGMFFRYNGFYILLVVVAALLIWLAVCMIRERSKCIGIAVVICALIIPTVLMHNFTGDLTQKYVMENVSKRAKHAMIIQQLAKCAEEHPESFDKNDKEALRKVMDVKLEKLADKYNPYQFDPIKDYFRNDASPEEMKGFYKVWLKMLKLHPRTCIDATVHQNYFLFSILAHNVRYYDNFTWMIQRDRYYDYSGLYHYEEPYLQTFLREQLTGYYKAFEHFPFIGLFTNQAIYTLLLVTLFLITCFTKDWKKLIILLPLLATLGIIIIGPACRNHARYLYPVVYVMPIVFILFATVNNKCDLSRTDTDTASKQSD